MIGDYVVTKLNESDMKNPVKDFFQKFGYKGFEEVPVGQKKIDLYFVHRNYPKTIAVELKINAWRRVLRQAYQNRFYAQQSYVGLWHDFLNENIALEINNFGLGVLKVYSNYVELVKKPDCRFLGILPPTKEILYKMIPYNDTDFLWRNVNEVLCQTC